MMWKRPSGPSRELLRPRAGYQKMIDVKYHLFVQQIGLPKTLHPKMSERISKPIQFEGKPAKEVPFLCTLLHPPYLRGADEKRPLSDLMGSYIHQAKLELDPMDPSWKAQ